jgi:hypothetical protein
MLRYEAVDPPDCCIIALMVEFQSVRTLCITRLHRSYEYRSTQVISLNLQWHQCKADTMIDLS